MKKASIFILTALFLLSYIPIYAELIDGPANIRYGSDNKIICSLNNNVPIACCSYGNGWYQIIFDAYINQNDLDSKLITNLQDEAPNNLKLTTGTQLYDNKGNVIGKILSNDELLVIYHSSQKINNLWSFEIVGYTNKCNIQKSSMSENVIVDKINSEKTIITESSICGFLTEHGYYPCNTNGNAEFDSYYHNYCSNGLMEGLPRIQIIFYKKVLVAISSDVELNIKFVKMHSGKYKRLGYIKLLDSWIEKDLENRYLE